MNTLDGLLEDIKKLADQMQKLEVQGKIGYTNAISYTPSCTSTGATFAYTYQVGYYMRVGMLVMFEFSIRLSGVPTGTLTNLVTINTPPVTSKNVACYPAIAFLFSGITFESGYAVLTGDVGQNSQTISLYESGSNKDIATIKASMFDGATTRIFGSGTYIAE